MRDAKEIVEYWKENKVTINLLLTRRCNFQCEHCFYDCGSNFRGYMSSDVLTAVKSQVQRLKDLDIHPTINLIGGEPTLNMARFAEILATVYRWDCDIEMTTNGWWLHKDDTARQFFNIVAQYVDGDGRGLETSHGSSLSIRISDDQFHDQFRPGYLRDGKMAQRLADVWDNPWDTGILYRVKNACLYCEKEYQDLYDGDECPECGQYIESIEEELLSWHLPRPDEYDPWVYVESRKFDKGWGSVIPIGRGAMGGHNDIGCKEYSNVMGLSYLPNGQLMDVCCKGSWCEFGTVCDDPLVLLETAHQFTKEVQPSCWGCRELAREWKRTRLPVIKKQVKKELIYE